MFTHVPYGSGCAGKYSAAHMWKCIQTLAENWLLARQQAVFNLCWIMPEQDPACLSLPAKCLHLGSGTSVPFFFFLLFNKFKKKNNMVV